MLVQALKERLVERANIIQARHDSETAALVKRQVSPCSESWHRKDYTTWCDQYMMGYDFAMANMFVRVSWVWGGAGGRGGGKMVTSAISLLLQPLQAEHTPSSLL